MNNHSFGRAVNVRCLISVATLCLTVGGAAAAQRPLPPPPAPGQPPMPVQPAMPTPPHPPAPMAIPPSAEALRPEPSGKPVNVQIDLVLSDQTGAVATEKTDKKTVSMLTADRTFGRVRVARGGASVRLNVDARPTILDNGMIRLELTLEYRPLSQGTTEPTTPLNESLTVLLQPGKPLTVSRAADPTTDRKVTVEVTAVIVK